MELVIAAALVVGISFLGLGVNIFFRKDGKFPETEVGTNKNMRKLGIKCVRCEEIGKHRKMKRQLRPKLDVKTLHLDTSV